MTADDENEVVLGGEDETFWTKSQGTATLSTSTTHSEGAASLAVTGTGFIEIVSSTVETTNGVGTELDYDVQLPVICSSCQTQAFLTSISRNVNHVSVGTQSLSAFPAGQFRTVRFTLASSLRTSLAGKVDDLRVDIVLNVPSTPTRTYLVDNIRLGLTAPPLVDDLVAALRILDFESLADWTGSNTTVSSSTNHSSGAASISFPANGSLVGATSHVLRALPTPTTHISFDVRPPTSRGAFGTIQLFASLPAKGLNNVPVGNAASLLAIPSNQFSTITVTVPSNLQTAFGQSFDDLRFTYQINAPSGVVYTIDNQRFTP